MRGHWQGEGRAVVLLHGQPGSGADWARVTPQLPGLRLLTPDRPGYDGTPARGFAGNAAALHHVLTASGVRRAVLVGHSWGAGVALHLAAEHAELVAGLCLIGPVGSPLAVTRADRLLALPGLRHVAGAAVAGTARTSPAVVEAVTGSAMTRDQRAGVRAAGRRWSRGGGLRAFGVEQRALVRDVDRLAALLPAVACPCLVVTGHRDTTVSPAAAADLAARLPHAVLQRVTGGHLLPLEAPELVAAAVRRVVASADW